jgi:hypothetical protein
MSATQKWVDGFAREMERKLSENRHKGDRDGWRTLTAGELLSRLEGEVRELRAAVNGLLDTEDGEGERAVVREAADVGNFAMMIADTVGQMKPKGGAR